MPAPKHNRNALKHGLYARHYPGEIKKNLLRWELDDFAAEIQLLRVTNERLLACLLTPMLDPETIARLGGAISHSVTSIVRASRQHVLFNSRENPVLVAWFDTVSAGEFFIAGDPPA